MKNLPCRKDQLVLSLIDASLTYQQNLISSSSSSSSSAHEHDTSVGEQHLQVVISRFELYEQYNSELHHHHHHDHPHPSQSNSSSITSSANTVRTASPIASSDAKPMDNSSDDLINHIHSSKHPIISCYSIHDSHRLIYPPHISFSIKVTPSSSSSCSSSIAAGISMIPPPSYRDSYHRHHHHRHHHHHHHRHHHDTDKSSSIEVVASIEPIVASIDKRTVDRY
jgi:hypothetical protein